MLVNILTPFRLTRLQSLKSPLFFFSQLKLDILASNYHLVGPNNFKKSRTIQKLLSGQLSAIQSLQGKLDPIRSNVVKSINSKDLTLIKQESLTNPQISEYVQLYQSLIKAIEACQINNEWVYNIISWYNMTSYYKVLLERLLKASQEEIFYLVKALYTMKYEWKNDNGYIDEVFLNDANLETFYKRLSLKTDIELLRKLDSVLKIPLNYPKRKFFEKYLHQNLESFLKNLNCNDDAMVEDLIWLFEASIVAMNDDEVLISKMEKYILTMRLSLKNEATERLMNAYLLKGKIQQNIYKEYIKPYIMNVKMNDYNAVVESIRFLICSEAADHELLQKLYAKISELKSIEQLQPQSVEILHIYTHYLRFKAAKFTLSKQIEGQLNQHCKKINRSNLNSIGKLVNGELQKKIHPQMRKYRFASDCNNLKNMKLENLPAEQMAAFQEQFGFKLGALDFKTARIYKNARFCCYNLEYCIHSKSTSQIIDFENDSISYAFSSGRLSRQVEIRDEILSHYGIKINHYNIQRFKNKGRMSEQEFLINRRVSTMRMFER